MSEQTKNLLIGLFVIAACVVIVSFIMFLHPRVGDMKKTYYIRFSDINKINVGTRVTYAGKPEGEVTAIREIFHAREQPSDTFGKLYTYELVVKVDSAVTIYNTDEISLQTSGLLGEKSVAIIPKAPKPGEKSFPLPPDQPIYAESGDPLENTFEKLSEVADDMQLVLKQVNHWIADHGEEVASTIKSAGNFMDEADTLLATVNNENLVYDVKDAIANFSKLTQDIDTSINQLTDDQFFINLSSTMSSIDSVTQDIAAGKGSLGKFLKSDEFYLDVTSLINKANTMMADINNYGLLFHLNKSWQRTHQKVEYNNTNLVECNE